MTAANWYVPHGSSQGVGAQPPDTSADVGMRGRRPMGQSLATRVKMYRQFCAQRIHDMIHPCGELCSKKYPRF